MYDIFCFIWLIAHKLLNSGQLRPLKLGPKSTYYNEPRVIWHLDYMS